MDRKQVLQIFVLLAIFILIIDVGLYSEILTTGETSIDINMAGILISLLPLSIILLILMRSGSGGSRLLWVAIGVITLTLAWEFLSDPWSISLRAGMGLSLQPLLIYNLIGLMLLIVAIVVFRRAE